MLKNQFAVTPYRAAMFDAVARLVVGETRCFNRDDLAREMGVRKTGSFYKAFNDLVKTGCFRVWRAYTSAGGIAMTYGDATWWAGSDAENGSWVMIPENEYE